MMAMIGAIGLAATAIGTLALSVLAGLVMLNGMLRALEAAVLKEETKQNVTDFAEFARRSTGSLATAPVELERAA